VQCRCCGARNDYGQARFCVTGIPYVMVRAKKPIYAWLDATTTAQIVYAAKRVGVVHVGLSKKELLESIRASPRRSCLRHPDVKYRRKTWAQVRYETNWEQWERDWQSESINVFSQSHMFAKTPEQSMMAYARDRLGLKWANMPVTQKRAWP
jgi:hypothetical protein